MIISNKMSNKKASFLLGFKPIYYLVSLVALAAIFGSMIYFISTYLTISASTPPGMQHDIFMQRFMNSPYCFVYVDKDTGRAYPGVLDWEKFNRQNLNNCYKSYKAGEEREMPVGFQTAVTDVTSIEPGMVYYKDIAFKLKLSLDPDTKKTIETNNWNDEIEIEYFKDVLVKYNGEIKRAKLRIEVRN